MTDIDRIKSTINLTDLINRKQELRSNGNGRYILGADHDSLMVDTHRNAWHWWSKDEHGDAIDWAGIYELGYGSGWDSSNPTMFKEALGWLSDFANLPAPDFGPGDLEARSLAKSKKRLMDQAKNYYAAAMIPDCPAYIYAQGRGFNPETISALALCQSTGGLWREISEDDRETAQSIGLIYKTDKGQWSDAIPAGCLVYTHQIRNRAIYFAGRAIEQKRHWNQRCPKAPYWAIHQFKGPLIVCEGQADAASIYQMGVNAVALCGVNVSGLDRDLIKLFDAVYLWADPDLAGRESVDRLADYIGPMLRIIGPPTAHRIENRHALKDANDYLQAGMNATGLATLLPLAAPYLDTLIKNCDQSQGAAYDQALEKLFLALATLDQADTLITLNRYRSKVCQELGIKQSDFARYLRAAKGITPDDEDSRFARGGQYCLEDGWTVIKSEANDGSPQIKPLANFSARISEVIRYDDGSNEPMIDFVIAGELATGERLPTITIPAQDFPQMNWVIQNWGIEAIISPGKGQQDQLRAAIQHLSGRPFNRMTYTHTGWRQIGDKMAYLTSAGPLGIENEKNKALAVDLKLGRNETNMIRYTLPQQPGDLRSAIEASLNFWHIAPAPITIPIWASMYLAPLSPFLSLDFGLWVHGKSGSMKSSIVATALAHYGDWTGRNAKNFLPANFVSTANATLMAAFQAKDIVLVIDDYAPASTSREQRERDQVASRLLRSMGNRASRQRMKDGRRFQADYPPRCLALITAEDLPPGQSIMARGIGVRVAIPPEGSKERREIEIRLGKAQDSDSYLYGQAMSGYLLWLSRHWDQFKVELPDLAAKNRDSFQSTGHARLPDAFGKLLTAVEMALFYFADSGVITDSQIREMKADARHALTTDMNEHAEAVESVDPCLLFRDTVTEQLDAQLWYLQPYDSSGNDGDWEPPNHGSRLAGYLDDHYVYLLPAAVTWAQEAHQRTGQPFPVGRNTLYKRLEEKGWLIPGQKSTETVYIPSTNTSPRVLKLRRDAIL